MKNKINKDRLNGIESDGCGIVLTKFGRKYQVKEKEIWLQLWSEKFLPSSKGRAIFSMVCKLHDSKDHFYHLDQHKSPT